MPNESSPFAAEGTVAHSVAEAMLRRELFDDEHAVPEVGSRMTVDGHEIEVTQKMHEFVRVYVDSVKAEADKPGAVTYIECKFDLTAIHPGMFGTADAVIHNAQERKLRVFDLKYGQGVVVEVEDNEQLMFYALGALLKTGATVDEIEIAIVQPRAHHADGADRRWSISPLDLVEFAGDLALKAQATEAPDAPLRAGEWCRFCPAAGRPCPALDAETKTIIAQEFSPPEVRGVPQYDPEELGRILRQLPMVEAYVKRVRSFAFFEALQGRGAPDFKLVDKRANREWRDPRTAAAMLQLEYGLTDEQIYEPAVPTMRSPAQIEDLIPKKEREGFNKLHKKESSGVTLVPIEDRRVAVKRDALSEFSSVATT